MNRFLKFSVIQYLLEELSSCGDVLASAILETLIGVFQRYKVSKPVFNLAVGQVKSMEHVENENVRKLVNYFLETARIGPRADIVKKWARPNTEAVEKLFKLNLPEILFRNKCTEEASNAFTGANTSKKVENAANNSYSSGISRNIVLHKASMASNTVEKNNTSNINNSASKKERSPQMKEAKAPSNAADSSSGKKSAKSFFTPERKQINLFNHKSNIKETGNYRLINPYLQQKSSSKEKNNSRFELRLPLLSESRKISAQQYAGSEDLLYDSFMDTNLADSGRTESKLARNLLGVGQIEMGGLRRATGLNTVRELVEWYSADEFVKVYSLVLYGVVSSKKAEKIICILHLIATRKMKYNIRNPYIDD